MSLSRRAMLQVAGLAALPTVARAAHPFDAWGAEVHARARAEPATLFRADERATVAAIADAILPRTDTPGALDIGAPAFVEVIVAEWMTDVERTAFRTGIAELEAHALATEGQSWPALDAPAQGRELDWAEATAEAPAETPTAGQRTFRRLKSYVQHAFFTSERVQREVLRTNITPGHYFGCAPLPSTEDDDA